MIYILTLTLLLVIAIMFSLLGTKSRITSPLPLHFLPWLLTLIVGISNYDQFYEFNERSFYSLLIWFTVIFIFYFIGELVNYKRENINVYYGGNDSNLLIVFYVQIMPDDFVMQLHRF